MTSLSSYDELKEIVATLTPEQRAFVSFRAAARCLPFLVQLTEDTKYQGTPDFGLQAFRATLAANVAARSSLPDTTYSRNKAEVVSSIVRNVPFYSDGIEHAFRVVGHAVLSRWEEEECYRCLILSVMSAREFSPDLQIEPFDTDTGERVEITDTDYPIEDLFGDLGLMDGRRPEEFFNEPIVLRPHEQDAWDAFLARLGDQPDWSFWSRWFGRLLVGRPLPRELQRRVALGLKDEVWGQGAGAVAEAISEIETGYLRETTEVHEDPHAPGDEAARLPRKAAKLILTRTEVAKPLLLDEGTEQFRLDHAGGPPTDAVEFARKSIANSLQHALDTNNNNALKADDEEVRLLSHALEHLPHEARHLGPAFHQAHISLDAKFASGEYPRSLAVEFLNNQLKAHTALFAEADPEIAKHINIYGLLSPPNALDAETTRDLQAAGEQLEDVLEADAQSAVEQYAAAVEPGKPPSKFSLAVLTHWLTQIGLHLDKAKKGEARFAWLVSLLKRLWDAWPG